MARASWFRAWWVVGSLALLMPGVSPALAQQTTIGTPYNRLTNGYSESVQTQWGLNFPGGFFRFNGGPAAPGLGGADPAAGLHFGAAGRNGFFNLAAGQGSRTGLVSQTSSLTTLNGHSGYIADASVTPFVIGVVPVVGGYPGMVVPQLPQFAAPVGVSPLQERLDRLQAAGETLGQPSSPGPAASAPAAQEEGNDAFSLKLRAARTSTAGQPAPSLAEIRRAAAAGADDAAARELHANIERGRTAEAAGKLGAARVYYEMAARRATGALRDELLAKLRALADK